MNNRSYVFYRRCVSETSFFLYLCWMHSIAENTNSLNSLICVHSILPSHPCSNRLYQRWTLLEHVIVMISHLFRGFPWEPHRERVDLSRVADLIMECSYAPIFYSHIYLYEIRWFFFHVKVKGISWIGQICVWRPRKTATTNASD